MTFIQRALGTVLLGAVLAFSVFGFLATYEPPRFLGFRIFYGVMGTAATLALVRLWIVRTEPKL